MCLDCGVEKSCCPADSRAHQSAYPSPAHNPPEPTSKIKPLPSHMLRHPLCRGFLHANHKFGCKLGKHWVYILGIFREAGNILHNLRGMNFDAHLEEFVSIVIISPFLLFLYSFLQHTTTTNPVLPLISTDPSVFPLEKCRPPSHRKWTWHSKMN